MTQLLIDHYNILKTRVLKTSMESLCILMQTHAYMHITERYIFLYLLNMRAMLVGKLLKYLPFHGTLLWWEVIDIRKEE